jgi:putative AlgH/UPF0301 family transcriptional regulator
MSAILLHMNEQDTKEAQRTVKKIDKMLVKLSRQLQLDLFNTKQKNLLYYMQYTSWSLNNLQKEIKKIMPSK